MFFRLFKMVRPSFRPSVNTSWRGRLVPRGWSWDGLSTARARLGTARARLGTVRARLGTARAGLGTLKTFAQNVQD